MAGQKTISTTWVQPPIPPLVAAYHVTGTGNPNPNGNYFLAGIHDGLPYYQNEAHTWFLFWNDDYGETWICTELYNDADGFFYNEGFFPIGLFYRGGDYSGSPTLHAGPE